LSFTSIDVVGLYSSIYCNSLSPAVPDHYKF
jgi:hypothetical protein